MSTLTSVLHVLRLFSTLAVSLREWALKKRIRANVSRENAESVRKKLQAALAARNMRRELDADPDVLHENDGYRRD